MPATTPRVRRLRLVAVAAAASTVLLQAACGASTDRTPPGDEPRVPNPFTAYVDCLRDNGVEMPPAPTDLPSPPPDASAPPGGFPSDPPPGVDPETWQRAREACESLRPTGVPGGLPSASGGSTAPGSS